MLKEKWLTSIASMIYRSAALNLFTENQTVYQKRQMTVKKYWRKEPLDDLIQRETPYLWKQSFQMLIDNNILKPEEILENITLFKEEIDVLCSLPTDLLKTSKTIKHLKLVGGSYKTMSG